MPAREITSTVKTSPDCLKSQRHHGEPCGKNRVSAVEALLLRPGSLCPGQAAAPPAPAMDPSRIVPGSGTAVAIKAKPKPVLAGVAVLGLGLVGLVLAVGLVEIAGAVEPVAFDTSAVVAATGPDVAVS